MFRIFTRASKPGIGAVAVLWLSACQVHSLTAASGGSSPTSSTEPAATAPTSPSSAEPAGEPTKNTPETFTGSTNSPYSAATDPPPTALDIERENDHRWTRLVGYSVAEATRRARTAGYTGVIKVEELQEFDAGCKDGTVCTFTPSRWEIGAERVLYLKVNRKLAITKPD